MRFVLFLSLAIGSSLHAALPGAPTVDYTSKVKPIFSKHCYECHSESRKKEKGGFVFDKPERLAKNIGRGLIIVPGDIGESDLIGVVSGANGKKKMPPEDKGELSAKEIETLKTWIMEGANVPGIDMAKLAEASRTKVVRTPMNWTNKEGKVIRATYEGMDGDYVLLRAENGKVYKYPMSNLNPAGQVQAKLQAAK